MDWEAYSAEVAGSRHLIAFPFFEKRLAGRAGTGADLGCGVGELSSRISEVSSAKVVGFDTDERSLREARDRFGNVHFVRGDIGRNVLSEVGIKLDFAFSNCCLCHIDDRDIDNAFLDLYQSMREGGELIFLVPSIEWAKDMYLDVKPTRSGITAVPRYGGRQFFRVPEWYVSALERCGFRQVEHFEIPIPDMPGLEDRYRERAGANLFSAFVATRAKDLPDVEAMREAFSVAHDNRKFEIQLFWQRSLFFWGFVAAALIGFGAAHNSDWALQTVFALFGLVCSVVWSAGNRGSKYWQEYWEEKVNYYQHYATGNIFYDRSPKEPKFTDMFAARRMSVSKLTMALSDFSVAFWLVLVVAPFLSSIEVSSLSLSVVAALGTLCYCLLLLRKAKSED